MVMAIGVTVLAGVLGTFCMWQSMRAITKSGLANADMVRAIGSIYTRNFDNALMPGLVMHFSMGVFIAFFYGAFLSWFPVEYYVGKMALGAMTGGLHGLVISFVLVVVVAESHPLEQFRNAGLSVAGAHVLGHIVYGAVVGITFGLAGVRYPFIKVLPTAGG